MGKPYRPFQSGIRDPKKDFEAKIVYSKKLLNRAMKLGKTFEYQKCNKRIKLAGRGAGSDEKKKRWAKEADILKNIELAELVDEHLYKTLLKTNAIVDSNLLPDYVVMPGRNSALTEEQALLKENVTARMYNTKPVKDAMEEVMELMYAAAGAKNPNERKISKKELKKRMVRNKDVRVSREELLALAAGPKNATKKAAKAEAKAQEVKTGPLLDGFDPGSEGDSESEDGGKQAQYNARIAASSDEDDSEDEQETFDPKQASSNPKNLKALNPRDLSITPSRSPSPADEEQPTAKRQKTEKPSKKTSKSKGLPAQTKPGSTFLPTLMGGYWSGTDESASEDERQRGPAAPAPRKNRRGQQARRAIAEKKFGGGAKHIKEGKGPADITGKRKREAREKERKSGNGRDDGWDGKRGASDGGRRGFKRSKETVTGENAAPLGDRKKIKHRDDVGALHASWAAAKAAKDAKVNAKFEGKKVVFD